MTNEIHAAASKPHERFLFNLAIIHFLLPALLFGTKQLWLIFTIPVLCSLLIMASIARQAINNKRHSELVLAHWQLAWKRCKYLILGYAASLSIFLIAVLMTQGETEQSTRFIQLAIAGWIALVPLSMAIIMLLVLENSALVQARKGIMPSEMKL